MSCPDPLYDYDDLMDDNDNEWIPVNHATVSPDSLSIVPEKKDSDTDNMVAFHQNQYKKAIWKAKVRRHMRG